jgi:hypothetical protein
MMGERTVMQEALFYEFSLERHVPADHLLRLIDRFVDLSGLRSHLRPFYSEIGRPSIDPELMIRMLMVGYCFGIRSERRLCEEVHLNLAYRWFCRLDKATSPITPPSRRTGTAAFAPAICCASCSRRRCADASRKDWSAVRALPSMRASSGQMRISSARQKDRNRSTGRRWRRPVARSRNISTRWTMLRGVRRTR